MKRNKNIVTAAAFAAMMMLAASCGTKRVVADGSQATVAETKNTGSGHTGSGSAKTGGTGTDAGAAALAQMNYLRKVSDNAVYSKNIVSKIKVSINTGSNDISVGGSLYMRRDEVIRIQITPFGIMEAGRLEFTKDYVLLIDRIHKEYVKASYADVDFLQKNGLDFYMLQSLFWNQLFVPGLQKVTDSSLKNFKTQLSGASTTDVTLAHGNMSYVWNTDSKTGLINSLNAKYGDGANNGASVNCKYSAFRQLGTKRFPSDIFLTMATKAIRNAGKMSLRLQLNTLGTDSSWEAKTTVSSKYRQVGLQEILGKLGSM